MKKMILLLNVMLLWSLALGENTQAKTGEWTEFAFSTGVTVLNYDISGLSTMLDNVMLFEKYVSKTDIRVQVVNPSNPTSDFFDSDEEIFDNELGVGLSAASSQTKVFNFVITCKICDTTPNYTNKFIIDTELNTFRDLKAGIETKGYFYNQGIMQFRTGTKAANRYYKFVLQYNCTNSISMNIGPQSDANSCHSTSVDSNQVILCKNQYDIQEYYEINIRVSDTSTAEDDMMKLLMTEHELDLSFPPVSGRIELKFTPEIRDLAFEWSPQISGGKNNLLTFEDKKAPGDDIKICIYDSKKVTINKNGDYENCKWTSPSSIDSTSIDIPHPESGTYPYYIIFQYTKADPTYSKTVTLVNELDYYELGADVEHSVDTLDSNRMSKLKIIKPVNDNIEFFVTPSSNQEVDIQIFYQSEEETDKTLVKAITHRTTEWKMKMLGNSPKKGVYFIEVKVAPSELSNAFLKIVAKDIRVPVYTNLLPWLPVEFTIDSDEDAYFQYNTDTYMGDTDFILYSLTAIGGNADIYVYTHELYSEEEGVLSEADWKSTGADTSKDSILIKPIPKNKSTNWKTLYILFRYKLNPFAQTKDTLYSNTIKMINQNEFSSIEEDINHSTAGAVGTTKYFELTKQANKNFKLVIKLEKTKNIHIELNKRFKDQLPLYEGDHSSTATISRHQEYSEKYIYELAIKMKDEIIDSDKLSIKFGDYIQPEEIKEGADIKDLDFDSKLLFAYYHNMENYSKDKAGVLTLSFTNKEDLKKLKFIAVIKQMDENDNDLGAQMPTEADTSEFPYKELNQQYLKLFYEQPFDPVENKKVIIFILIVFDSKPASKSAKFDQFRIEKSINLISMQNDQIPLTIDDYAPQIYEVIVDPSKGTVLFSEYALNIYEETLVPIRNPIVTNMYSIPKGSKIKAIYVEFYGPASTTEVFLRYQSMLDSIISATVPLSYGSDIPYKCNTVDETIYFTLAFTDLSKNEADWLYLKEDWGTLELEYYNFKTIDASQKEILPTTLNKLTGPEQVVNPFYIFKAKCIFPGSVSFGLAKKDQVTNITKRGVITRFIMGVGSRYVNIEDMTNPINVEIRFAHCKKPSNEATDHDIDIDIEGKHHYLTVSNRILRVANCKNKLIIVDSPFDDLVLEIKTSPTQSMVQVKDLEINLKAKLIYYKLESERASSYKFTFDKLPSKELEMDIGKGEEGFIPLPTTPITSNSNGEIIYADNPYYALGGLNANEFYYISFRIPEIVQFVAFKAEPIIDVSVEVIDEVSLNSLTHSVSSLHSNKKITNTHLVVFVNQCEVKEYNLQLSYQNVKLDPRYVGKDNREVYSFKNQFLPYEIEYKYTDSNETTNFDYLLSYAYLNIDDSDRIRKITNSVYKLNFDEATFKLSWDKPDPLATKYRVYLSPKGTSVSNECELFKKQAMTEIEANEFNFANSNVIDGEYKINILGVGEDKMRYLVPYEELEIKLALPDIHEIKDLDTPITIDFKSMPRYSIFYNLKDYQPGEEGVFTLSFDTEIPELASNTFKFFSKIVQIPSSENKKAHLPETENDSQFVYTLEGKTHLKMYFFNSETAQAGKDIFFLINFVFDTAPTFTAKLSTSKVSKQEVFFGGKDIERNTVTLKENIPHFIKIRDDDGKFEQRILFFSNIVVHVYEESIFLNKALNVRETLNMKLLNLNDHKKTFIVEFFGPAGEVYYQFEKVDYSFNWIDSNLIDDVEIVICDSENINTPQYYASSLDDVIDLDQFYINLNKRYGLFTYYFINQIQLEGSVSSILSNIDKPFSGLALIGSTYFILKFKCLYPGQTDLQFSKLSEIIVMDETTTSSTHVITPGSYLVDLNNLNRRNIEISLLQIIRSDVTITVGTVTHKLNANTEVVRFPIQDDATAHITISNPSDTVALDFKISSLVELKEVVGNNDLLSDQNVYYKLQSERASHYVFEFNSLITQEFKYEFGKGQVEYIPQPSNLLEHSGETSFRVENPYNTYGELLPNEFYYYAIYVPAGSFRLKVTPMNPLPPHHEIDFQILDKYTADKNSLHLNKEKDKTSLVIYMAQCGEKSDYKMKLLYNNVEVESRSLNEYRQVLTFPNSYIPLDIETTSSSNPSKLGYLLSYNYLTTQEKDQISASITNLNINFDGKKLTWDKIDSVTEYDVYFMKKDSSADITSECALYSQSPTITVKTNEYSFPLNETPYGSYKVNVLVRYSGNLSYVVAYTPYNFKFKNPNTTWIWVGVVLGIVVLLAIGVGIFFLRRKRRLDVSKMNFDQLIISQEPNIQGQLDTL